MLSAALLHWKWCNMSGNKPKKKPKTINARLDELENHAGDDDENNEPALNICWHCIGDPEPVHEPGTLVIEWGENDEIISYGVPSDGKKKHNNPH